jgi:hypothetical protein
MAQERGAFKDDVGAVASARRTVRAPPMRAAACCPDFSHRSVDAR